MRVEEIDLEEWGTVLPDRGFEPFHCPAALRALADHDPGELRLFAGYRGQEPLALFPAFVRDYRVGRAVFSPPPARAVPRLGPLTMPASPKRRKRERVNTEFVEAVLEQLDAHDTRTLFRAVCGANYADPRPFAWRDLSVHPRFTYVLDVSPGTDALWSSFSRSLRREIDDARELDVTVELAGIDGVRRIYDETVDRYEEQDREFNVSWPYVRDLATGLDDRCRAYVLRDGSGAFLSGVTVLYSNDAAYYWQGGARTVHEGVSVNGLLHWRIVEDIDAGDAPAPVDGYDLIGANTERICSYKAKFDADLVPYWVAESEGAAMGMAKKAYRSLTG
jgi:hypothetical protein